MKSPEPMNLQEHYTQLWEHAEGVFTAGNFQLDPLIDSSQDTRRGLTLLARPSPEVKQAIQSLLQELAEVEPTQYYYPTSDIHLTVLSIISCYPGFTPEVIHLPSYVELLEKALASLPSFDIRYSGLTASPSCILVQGYPKNNTLEKLRANVREAFRTSELQQSIDQRYAISTAHSTIARFRHPLSQPERFLQKLQEHRAKEFGTATIDRLELVYNDWYQRESTTQILATFALR